MPFVFCTVTAVMAVMPNTPSALKVFRSAWIPAPPPESKPAIVSARGLEASTGGKVVPSARLERRLRAVRVPGHQALALRDLADLGQRAGEPLLELPSGPVHGHPIQGCQ